MTIHQRIKQKLDEKNLKPADLARATKKSPVAVGKWINGESVPKAENLKAIARFLGVSDDWLLTGKEAIRRENFSGEQAQQSEPEHYSFLKETVFRKILVLDFVQAGEWREVIYDGQNPIGYAVTDYKGSEPEAVFGLIVDGLSMTPNFNPTDLIVIDPCLNPSPGDYVVAQKNDEKATFKKYRVTGYSFDGRDEFELKPLNPDFPTLNSSDGDIKVIGVMVRHTVNYK